jgi:hypothetical protein
MYIVIAQIPFIYYRVFTTDGTKVFVDIITFYWHKYC